MYGLPKEILTLGPFLDGWVTKDDPFRVSAGALIDGRNVTISADGYLVGRPGRVRLDIGTAFGSVGYGLFAAYKSDGTRYFLKAAGTSIYYFNSTTKKWVALSLDDDLTLPSGFRTRFAVYDDEVFIVNGSNALMKWDFNVDHNVVPANINSPGAAATQSTTIDGSLEESADYYYKYKYRNSTYGTLSPASPISAAMTTGADPADGNRVAIPANGSVDAQVDKVWIYRTVHDPSTPESAVFYYVGEVDYSGVATTFDDTVADADLSVEMDVSTEAPPDGARYILSAYNMLFLSGFDVYPNRVYFSRVGYPSYFTDPTLGSSRYLDVGKSEGDRVVGLRPKYGYVRIYKSSSRWKLENADVPASTNLQELDRRYGCIAPDSISDDGDFYVSNEGVVFIDNNEQPHIISDNVADIFKGMREYSISRDVLANVSGVYHENRYLLSYSSKRGTVGTSASVKTGEIVETSGNNRATASLNADYSLNNLQSSDAVYSLNNSQSSENGWFEIRIGVNWNLDNFHEEIKYKVFVSHDNRNTWVEKATFTEKFEVQANIFTSENRNDYKYTIPPKDEYIRRFYENNVTDIRIDLIESTTIATWGQGPSSISFNMVSYYYDSTSLDVEPDRTLCFHINKISYDPILKKYFCPVDPPWEFGTRMWAVASGGSDKNELLLLDSKTGRVWKLVDDEKTDDGQKFLSWFRTGNRFMKGNVLVSKVPVDRFPTNGQCTVELYIDNNEVAQEQLFFEGGGISYGVDNFDTENFGSLTSVLQDGIECDNSCFGKYVGLRVWSEDGNLGDILGFRVIGIKMPDRI